MTNRCIDYEANYIEESLPKDLPAYILENRKDAQHDASALDLKYAIQNFEDMLARFGIDKVLMQLDPAMFMDLRDYFLDTKTS